MTQRMSMRILASMFVLFSAAAWADNAPTVSCRTVEGHRVDTADQVKAMADVCTVTSGMGVFTEGVKEITFEHLKSIGTLNIEADDLEAIAFPALEEVRYLRISGGDLKVAEFPRLKHVTDTFYVKSKNLKYLHLPSLRTVGRFFIEKNPSLEFVFADKLYDIRELHIDGNPRLAPGTADVLNGVTQNLSQAELDAINNAEKTARELKVQLANQMRTPPPPPTGHATTFNSFGNYYQAYPTAFWNYWSYIGPWHYNRWYYGWNWW